MSVRFTPDSVRISLAREPILRMTDSLYVLFGCILMLATLLLRPEIIAAQASPNPPIVSHSAGFYSEPFELSILTSAPNLTILYTLDGSEPHPDNLQASHYQIKLGYQRHPFSPPGSFTTDSLQTFIYTEPLLISDATASPNRYSRVNTTWDERAIYAPFLSNPKAITLRVRTMSSTGAMSPVFTHTYFVQNNGRFTHSLPVVSVAISPDKLFSYEEGIYVAGAVYDQWRDDNPTLSAHAFSYANYTVRGDEAEHPGSFELFDQGSRVFSQYVGFRIHGGATRSFPLKSLRMYARNEYSTNTLDYPFFENSEDDRFRRLIIRNNGDDFLRGLIRDRFHHRMVHHLGFETQLDQPVVTYLNGEYWGLKALRERIDRHYIARRFDLGSAPIDMMSSKMFVEEGSDQHFRELMQFVEDNDLSDPQAYRIVGEMVDIDNLIRYLVAQMYIMNTDWPQNNIRYWRLALSESNPEADSGRDGRWRWIFFDTDIGSLSTLYERNSLEHIANPDEDVAWFGRLPVALMQNSEFKAAFVNRFAEEMNLGFSPQVLENLARQMAHEIADEVAPHIARWKRPVSVTDWEASVQEIITFAHKRPAYMRKHLMEYFAITDTVRIEIDLQEVQHGRVQLHTATFGRQDTPIWSGTYFSGIPLQVTAIPDSGYKFDGWRGTFTHQEADFIIIPDKQDILLVPDFVPSVSSLDDANIPIAANIYLEQNRPNPFNPTTEIYFRIKGDAASVNVIVYDVMGRRVAVLADDLFPIGTHAVRFDASGLPSGVYFYVLQSDQVRETKMMTLIR